MMEAVCEETMGDKVVKIYPDDNPPSPREWDNLGSMVCFHKRYELGDKHDLKPDSYSGWKEVRAYLAKKQGAAVILPLYLFDHGGLTMDVDPERFRACDSAGWDWGQVGFIYATRARILQEFGRKKLSSKLRSTVAGVLRNEVEIYDRYLQGDVYGFVIESPEGEHLDSCWGFFGEEDAIEAAREAAKEVSDGRSQI